MTDRAYFTIAAGSPAAKPIMAWRDSIVQHKAWARAFAAKHGLADADWIGLYGIELCGFAPAGPKPGAFRTSAQWEGWLTAHPDWRRIKARAGSSDYAVPRKRAKDLWAEWVGRPRVLNSDEVVTQVTGLGFQDLLHGLTLYRVNWRIRDDGSILLVVPHFATKSAGWKPSKGIKRGNQDKLRDEWEAK